MINQSKSYECKLVVNHQANQIRLNKRNIQITANLFILGHLKMQFDMKCKEIKKKQLEVGNKLPNVSIETNSVRCRLVAFNSSQDETIFRFRMFDIGDDVDDDDRCFDVESFSSSKLDAIDIGENSTKLD